MIAQHDAFEVLTANLGNLPGATGPACYLDQLSIQPAGDGPEIRATDFSVAKPLLHHLTDLTRAMCRKVTRYRGAEDTVFRSPALGRRPG
ncbi:hypothetical protein [Dongia sp.]|uniref:hypothetical protein n=1 Tax=Dongia sp. TaxID=1977262 RepID=UPI0035AF44CC